MSCCIHRVITLNQAIPFGAIQLTTTEGVDITQSSQFAWSVDGACWTSWCSYLQYQSIAPNLETDFYLRIQIYGAAPLIYVNGIQVTDYTICTPQHLFTELACDNPNTFNPYANLDCAIMLQQQLSDSVICMFGLPIYYFRTDPVVDSADYTFKEFSLHNVVDCKQIKLMIEDGQMPSSNPKLTDLDFDWEVDWETEISKTQFARAFGDNVFPKARDFVYIPLMRRMWEVNAAYDEKRDGLMWRSTTWKLALMKYNDSTNILGTDFSDSIDSLIGKRYQDTFGNLEEMEQDRQTGSAQVQSPRFSATNLYNIFMEDAVRQAYTKADIDIKEKLICHRNSVVSRNIYEFKNSNGCITYQKGYCGDSGAIMMLVETGGDTIESAGPIAEFGPIRLEYWYDSKEKEYNIGADGMYGTLQLQSTYLLIYKWNRSTHTRDLLIFKQTHRTDFPVYLLKPEQYWFDTDEPIVELVESYNNDYIVSREQLCQVHGWPLKLSNIKLYNKELSREEAIMESLKYTTTHSACVFADLARPTNSGQGFDVK